MYREALSAQYRALHGDVTLSIARIPAPQEAKAVAPSSFRKASGILLPHSK